MSLYWFRILFVSCLLCYYCHTGNLIGNISNAIPDPPFLQEDGYIPADMAALMNGEAPPTYSSQAIPAVTGSGTQASVPPQQTLLLTTDEDTLD